MKRMISNHSKKITSCLVALSILLTTAFSAISIKGIFVSAVEPVDYWDGNVSDTFAGGEGTAQNPYLIENGGQLYKAISDLGKKTDGTAAYYLIMKDLYLNNDYESYTDWVTNAPKNNWLPTRGNFIGHLDGGRHTVYGLYSVTGSWRNGLIPYTDSGATVKNLVIAKSYIHNNDSNAGAVVGAMYNNTKIEACLVYDTIVSANGTDVGGIVGAATKNTVTVSNCGTYNVTVSGGSNAGGILGRAWQGVSGSNGTRILNCFSVDNFPLGNNNNIWVTASYTNVSGSKNGVIVIDKTKMQGDDAVINMGLSEDVWRVTDSFPTICLPDVSESVWDGTKATEFSGGDGTKNNPFLIENGSQLYKAVSDLGKKTDGTAAYYLITKDLYLNSDYENYSYWVTNAPKNNWLPTRGDFIGHIDGDFHTIYGLYSVTGSWRNGLIPYMNSGATVSNLIIAKSYVRDNDSTAGAVVGAMYNNTKVESCVVYDTVISAKGTDVGGIVGAAAKNTVTVSNCATYNVTVSGGSNVGGILGRAWQGVSGSNGTRILNCFSVDNFPLGNNNNIWVTASYTNVSGSKNGVVVIEKTKMQGEDAISNMGLSDTIWKATESYPIIYKFADPDEEDDVDDTVSVWDGTVATEFAGGSGTDTDPYLIENGAQLYKAINDLGKKTDGTAASYLITADIYLNKGYKNYNSWETKTPKNNWNPTHGDFIGHIDGGYHTVYGLYSVTGSWRNGLIPYINSGATVSNLIIAKSYIRNNTDVAGAVTGAMYDNTKIERCLVYDTVVTVANQDVGGIVGVAAKNTATISNCGTYDVVISGNNAGGILGRAYQNVAGANGTRVLSCFSVDNFPLGNTDKIWASGCYTNVVGTKGGITVIEKSEMQGEGAVANMAFSSAIWIDTEYYPVLVDFQEVKGDVWSGIAATRFAGGSGKATDPYLIETASQLYKAICDLGKGADGEAAHYLLTADIYLNKDYDNYESWGSTPPQNNWLPITASTDFVGHLNGGGYTVYGLYVDKSVWCAGLIARVRGGTVTDINVTKSYIQSTGGTVGGIVGMAYSQTNVSRCKVYDTIIVDKAGTDLGGIVGAAERSVMITGCASYNISPLSEGMTGGILGRAWSSAYIRESYSVGLYPLSINKDTYRVGCINVYTDTKGTNKSGITVLENDDMKGDKAFEKMPLHNAIWKPDSKGYPVFCDYVNGQKGEIWTGGIAENYAGGEGTKENPYLIETGEQLYKLVFENCVPSNVSKYYKVTSDIRLNNTDDDKWYEKKDVNMWHIVRTYSFSFGGHLDGNGHTVSGIYTESETGNAYAGLIPVIDMGSSVKNIGVINSNISTAASVAENFTGGIVGWIDDWDSSNPELVIPENIPVISNCFADETVTLNGMYCGGILAGVAAPVLVENCYFTGDFDNYSTAACIIGNVWTLGSKISHCYAATSGMYGFAGGQAVSKNELEYEACYNFGKGSGTNFYFVSLYDIRGEKAIKTLSQLDFKNIWRTVDGGTPVLRIFGDNADKFSSKKDVHSTVSFITNVAGMSIKPISGIIDSPIELPKPEREGYNFAGWFVYSELQCEYTDDTFPYINLTLYAKWEPSGIAQDFESYPNTDYDLDNDYVYFRPGVENYDGGSIHGGNKAIKRLGNSSERQDFLVKYEQELTVGKEYTVSFWMMTETKGATGKVSMLNATWPDIAEPVKGEEMTIAEYKNLSKGEWKQYRYTFTASTPWITFRTDGNTVLYFDDILVYPSK